MNQTLLGSVLLVTYQYEDMTVNDTDIEMEYTDEYITSWKGISIKIKLTKLSTKYNLDYSLVDLDRERNPAIGHHLHIMQVGSINHKKTHNVIKS